MRGLDSGCFGWGSMCWWWFGGCYFLGFGALGGFYWCSAWYDGGLGLLVAGCWVECLGVVI